MLNPSRVTQQSFIAFSVIGLIIFRAFLVFIIPLMDQTEARYAEIARLMAETQDWVVLHIDYNVPFWAKPPLSTWLTATSFSLFGYNEWSARLPSLLISILLIIILYRTVKKAGTSFYFMAFILMTMPQFLLHMGVVSTDSAFGFCVAMVMLCFWNSQFKEKSILWCYGFFIFIGLGLLSKGPVTLALVVPPLAVWSGIQQEKARMIFNRLPWTLGILLTCFLAFPWYLLVERQSPGFLNYFIIGEHFSRFLETGWQGDLYGYAKATTKGKIWLFLFILAFPWVQLVFYWLWKNKGVIKYSSWVLFLTLWMLWTPIFFTFSSSISHTYVIPILAPIAMLANFAWKSVNKKSAFLITSMVLPMAAFLVFLVGSASGKLEDYFNTDKYLIAQIEAGSNIDQAPVYYWKKKSYSGQFYSQGKATILPSMTSLNFTTLSREKFYLVALNDEVEEIRNRHLFKLLKKNHKRTLLEYQGGMTP